MFMAIGEAPPPPRQMWQQSRLAEVVFQRVLLLRNFGHGRSQIHLSYRRAARKALHRMGH